MSEAKQLSSKEIAQLCVKIADDRKAENVIMLDVSSLSFIADYFVVCTANNQPHINAISEQIGRGLRNEHDIRPRAIEGKPQSGWILLDYGMVIVHVLTEETRERYDLESLWGDAPKQEAIEVLAQMAK